MMMTTRILACKWQRRRWPPSLPNPAPPPSLALTRLPKHSGAAFSLFLPLSLSLADPPSLTSTWLELDRNLIVRPSVGRVYCGCLFMFRWLLVFSCIALLPFLIRVGPFLLSDVVLEADLFLSEALPEQNFISGMFLSGITDPAGNESRTMAANKVGR